jgi:predicted neuraminidase
MDQNRTEAAPIHEHIVEEARPFRQCHASTLVALGPGEFLAAWFAGSREGRPDVAVWGATRRGGRWSAPRLLAKVADCAHWNPVLFRAPAGEVHLFFKVGETIPAWETWRQISRDDGETWGEPEPLVTGGRGGRGPVKNKPIVLSDGAWLAPASIEGEGRWDAFVDRSEDDGRTWIASDLIPLHRASHAGLGVIQPTLWESAPGQVHMLLRSTSGRVCRSDSADGGRTWSAVYPTALPNNNSGLDLARLPSGALALAYNPVAGDWAARTPLSISLSLDNGATWPRRLDLETEAGEYSYPAIIATGADGLAVTYTWRRERVAFWSGAVGDLPLAPEA